MSTELLEKVWEQARMLSEKERAELRERLLDPVEPLPPPRDEAEMRARLALLDQRLLAKGAMSRIPPPITDFSTYQDRELVEIEGRPISETVVEDRR